MTRQPIVPSYLVPRVTLECVICGSNDVPQLQRSGPNLGAYCKSCGSYIKWVKQSMDWKALERIQNR